MVAAQGGYVHSRLRDNDTSLITRWSRWRCFAFNGSSAPRYIFLTLNTQSADQIPSPSPPECTLRHTPASPTRQSQSTRVPHCDSLNPIVHQFKELTIFVSISQPLRRLTLFASSVYRLHPFKRLFLRFHMWANRQRKATSETGFYGNMNEETTDSYFPERGRTEPI